VGLSCLTPLLKNISVISWWLVLLMEEPEDLEKTIGLSQITDVFKAISIYVVKHKGASSITEFFKDGKKFVFNMIN
jgi:hypothetical protein